MPHGKLCSHGLDSGRGIGCAQRLVQPHTAADGGTVVVSGSVVLSEVRGRFAPAAERGAFGSSNHTVKLPVRMELRILEE